MEAESGSRMSPSSPLSVWVHLVPELHPERWIVINAFLLTYSAILFAIIIFGTEDSSGTQLAKGSYLYYNLVACIIWVIEIGFKVMWRLRSHLPSNLLGTTTIHDDPTFSSCSASPPGGTWSSLSTCAKWSLTIELILAIYFVLDSITLVAKKSLNQQHLLPMFIDVLINFIAYAYLTCELYQEQRRRQEAHSIFRGEDQLLG